MTIFNRLSAIFVGGPIDGDIRTLEDEYPIYEVYENYMPDVKVHTYDREYMFCNGEPLLFYVHSSLRKQNWMEYLVKSLYEARMKIIELETQI